MSHSEVVFVVVIVIFITVVSIPVMMVHVVFTPITITTTNSTNRLVGLVVKASASRAEGPGFESRWRRDFFGVQSYQ